MFARVFGKLRSTQVGSSAASPPGADGQRRLIPQAVFDGANGDFLREIGVSADDSSNLMLTQEAVNARAEQSHALLNAHIADINTGLPGGARVAAYAMLPWAMWQRRHAAMLMVTCGFYPTQFWNTFLLPEDANSAALLGLPQHPRIYPDRLHDALDQAFDSFATDFHQGQEQIQKAVLAGRTGAFGQVDSVTQELKLNIVAIAHESVRATFGEAIYENHRKLFAYKLGWSDTDAEPL